MESARTLAQFPVIAILSGGKKMARAFGHTGADAWL